MDRWRFYDITHRDHVICNPFSGAKLDELVGLLDLPEGAHALDIACGKAELLMRLAERYGIVGDGVDLSPYCVADARALAQRRVPGAVLRFHEQAGADFAAPAASYDLAMCIGASWAFGGHRGTLLALSRWARPGGLVVVGEPFWRRPPTEADLRAGGYTADAFATHAENVAVGVALDLVPLYTLASSEDDWDRYQGLRWRAAERHALAHPDDPDLPELLERSRAGRDSYLSWERDTIGWAIYLFQNPARVSG